MANGDSLVRAPRCAARRWPVALLGAAALVLLSFAFLTPPPSLAAIFAESTSSCDSSAPSVNVGSASGELVFDVLCIVPPLAGGRRPAARQGEERKA